MPVFVTWLIFASYSYNDLLIVALDIFLRLSKRIYNGRESDRKGEHCGQARAHEAVRYMGSGEDLAQLYPEVGSACYGGEWLLATY